MKIFILKLENNKYYIGRTDKQEFNLEDYNNNIQWTQINKPLVLLESIETDNPFDEDKYTKYYMDIFGIDNVRGSIYNEIILNDNDKKFILKEIHKTKLCQNCGQDNHNIENCKLGCNSNCKIYNQLTISPTYLDYCDELFNDTIETKQTEEFENNSTDQFYLNNFKYCGIICSDKEFIINFDKIINFLPKLDNYLDPIKKINKLNINYYYLETNSYIFAQILEIVTNNIILKLDIGLLDELIKFGLNLNKIYEMFVGKKSFIIYEPTLNCFFAENDNLSKFKFVEDTYVWNINNTFPKLNYIDAVKQIKNLNDPNKIKVIENEYSFYIFWF